MPRTSERGGPQTRARILEVSNRLFMERGFDAVTVAEVAREAGVSSVTVFNHFPTKEALFLDRSDEVVDLLRSAVRDRTAGTAVTDALREAALRLSAARHPLSGLADADDRVVPFLRTVAASPALIARARQVAAELQATLVDELERDSTFDGDAALFAAFFVAGYATVFTENARRLIAGESPHAVVADHSVRLERLFDALRNGVAPPERKETP
jgi:AcrR family transcriptional regulator